MNVDQLKGLLQQFKGEAKRQWGKLTDDDWKVVEGDAEKLAGKLRERYGHTKETAQAEIDKLAASVSRAKDKARAAGGLSDTPPLPLNGDQLKGKWKQLTGELKRRWGKLTDDDLRVAEGDAEKLAGKIQERYGQSKEAAKQELESLFRTLK